MIRIGRRAIAAIAILGSALALSLGGASCVGEGGYEDFACPNHDVFVQSVSPYLERRCGTLDCHGQTTRPMRLYGQYGLRHPTENNVSGGVATTDLEKADNFASVCNQDPAPMQQVTEDRGVSAEKLLLVNKARGKEKHKGGKVVNEQDPGDQCILGWLRLMPPDQVAASCSAAIQPLK